MKKKRLAFFVVICFLTHFANAQTEDVEGRVVFVSDRSGSQNLWILDVKTSELFQLTNFPGPYGIVIVSSPRWSPDGEMISFSAGAGNPESLEIFLINADGSGIEQVTFYPDSHGANFPAWDPLNSNILYYKKFLPATSSNVQRLNLLTMQDDSIPNSSGSTVARFDISTDGMEMLFTRQQSCCNGYLNYSGYQDFLGSSERIIRPIDGIAEHISRINRQDDWILFSEYAGGGNNNVFKMDKDGFNVTQLTFESNSYNAVWTSGDNEGVIIFETYYFGNSDIVMMRADGFSFPVEMQNLSEHPAEDKDPDWTPFGSNHPPMAQDLPVVTDEDCSAQLILPAVDEDDDFLAFIVLSMPLNGFLEGTAPNLSYTPNLNYYGSDSFTFMVNDGTEDSNVATVNITINPINDPPISNAAGPYVGNEGWPILFDGSQSFDLDSAIVSYEWDFNDDGIFDLTSTTPTTPHTIYDDYFGFISLRVIDDEGDFSTDKAQLIVKNVAPDVEDISAPVDPVMVLTEIEASAVFNDPGINDTHTAHWNWGDESTSEGIVEESNGAGTVYGTHSYSTPGVYTITLTVEDDDGGQDFSQFKYEVVYDPDGGFVTGGGWINSPAGAYAADPTLEGKANFGFVSKYKKGADTPSGNTEFQFKASDLNFHSSDYDWMVIAGPKAQYKGTGTINGEGTYGFKLFAIDEKLTPSTDFDLFRIKIWDKNNNDVIVYDNQMEAEEDADPTTKIESGSIIIHK